MSVDLSPEERARIVAERADVKYGPFASLHEAYGVLAEEIWECAGALHTLYDSETPKIDMYPSIVGNDARGFVARVQEVRENALVLQSQVTAIESEAIDVIAVCDRIIAQWGEKQ